MSNLWSAKTRIDPLCFQSTCRRRRLDLALVFMVSLWNRADHYIFALWFLLCSSFFSSPNLSRRRLDVCHTSTDSVALVQFQMQVWNVLHAALWKCRMQKSCQKSPSGHHRTILLGYIYATKAHFDIRKKLVKQQCVLQISLQYGELRPTSGWDRSSSLGHPS